MPISAVAVLPDPEVLGAYLQKALPAFADTAWVASVGSTNQVLMAQTRSDAPLAKPLATTLQWPRLLGAHHQTAGRGRAGRPWQEQHAQALMFSCGFQLNESLPALAGLSPALGLASAHVLNTCLSATSHQVLVKWPNDLMLADGKLGGILVESALRHQHTPQGLFVVIGMGLNLAGHAQLTQTLNRSVADWSQTGVHIEAGELVARLATAWQTTLQTLMSEGFESFMQSWSALDYLRGRQVSVTHQDAVLKEGQAEGVTGDGSLALRLANGTVAPIMVGDVSIRWDSQVNQTTQVTQHSDNR